MTGPRSAAADPSAPASGGPPSNHRQADRAEAAHAPRGLDDLNAPANRRPTSRPGHVQISHRYHAVGGDDLATGCSSDSAKLPIFGCT